MKRVIVYCEGPTEETFLNRLLGPYLADKGVYLFASCCNGVARYAAIHRDLISLCRSDTTATITTMLDFYGIPGDTPGYHESDENSFYQVAERIERKIEEDIDAQNFHAFLMVHEFEALLFTEPDCFSYCMEAQSVRSLNLVRKQFPNPEAIDHGQSTAPSKRILKVYPAYSKIVDGYNIATLIGIDKMRDSCPHFNQWVSWMENLQKD